VIGKKLHIPRPHLSRAGWRHAMSSASRRAAAHGGRVGRELRSTTPESCIRLATGPRRCGRDMSFLPTQDSEFGVSCTDPRRYSRKNRWFGGARDRRLRARRGAVAPNGAGRGFALNGAKTRAPWGITARPSKRLASLGEEDWLGFERRLTRVRV